MSFMWYNAVWLAVTSFFGIFAIAVANKPMVWDGPAKIGFVFKQLVILGFTIAFLLGYR